jgi:hypothetical protein
MAFGFIMWASPDALGSMRIIDDSRSSMLR